MPRLLKALPVLPPLISLVFLLLAPSPVNAQRRDHLTDEEIELIRDVQEVDKRMEIYTRAIDRRLIAIEGTSALGKDDLKRLEKEKEYFGDLPEGSRTQLISDIDKILGEAVDKIEDVADHNIKSDLFPVAVYILADYARKLEPKLEGLRANSANSRDVALLNSAIGQCEDIVQASSKVTRPEPKAGKKKKKGS